MTNAFSGADVAQLRILSSKFKSQSGKLREIAVSSSTALLVAEWTGNEIDAIRSNWSRKSLPTLNALADALQTMGVDLDRQAADQEGASGARVGSSTSFFDDILRGFATLVGIGIGTLFPHNFKPEGAPKPKNSAPAPQLASTPKTSPTPEASAAPAFDKDREQQEYDKGGFTSDFFKPGHPGAGECTSWVNFRRNELAQEGQLDGRPVPIAWKLPSRTNFYPGEVSNVPTQWAVGSYANEANNHTFVVESVAPDPPKSIFISEMNAGKGGHGNVSTDTWTWDESQGTWHSKRFNMNRKISFGA